jgi:hypothetical protein
MYILLSSLKHKNSCSSIRGFNDAISGFNDDGWSVMGGDGIEDVVIACNSTKKIRNTSNAGITFGAPGGIICAKASMLLQVRVIIVCVKALSVQSFHILYLEIKGEKQVPLHIALCRSKQMNCRILLSYIVPLNQKHNIVLV